MKNFSLCLFLFIVLFTNKLLAQSTSKLILQHKGYASTLKEVEIKTNLPPNSNKLLKKSSNKNTSLKSNNIFVGTTTYDLQTTGSMPRRMNYYSDLSISMAWIGSLQDSNYSDLGTWYNKFNLGTPIIVPNQRLESIRTANGILNKTRDGEISIASGGLVTIKNSANTVWDTTRSLIELQNLFYPRTASVGDTIYTIFISTQPDSISGFKSPIYFTRSFDGGLTFSTPSTLFAQAAGYDTSNHTGNIGPDHYAIDAVGNTVAILLLGVTEDVIVLKSTNNGDTWTKTIVQEFPIHKYNGGTTDLNGDGICDTVTGVTGDGSIVIGENNIVHVVYSDLLLRKCDTNLMTIYPFDKSDYFKYWNDNQKTTYEIPCLLDLNGDGIFNVGANSIGNDNIRYGNSGFSMHPMLASLISQNSTSESIFLVYSAVTEVDTNDDGLNYHGIYVIPNVGNLFSGIIDISQSVSQENVFPNIPARMEIYNPFNPDIYIQWQQDFNPGVAVNGHHASTVNDIVIGYPSFIGIGNNTTIKNKVYPNPAIHSLTIEIESYLTSTAAIKLVNSLGQEIYCKTLQIENGLNKENINIDSIIPGLYTLIINTNNASTSEKIIIK